jgi:hypothetical protein
MGKTYFPREEWDEEEKDPIKMLEKWGKRNRDAIQLTLNLEIIEKAARENTCPMYDTVKYCALFPNERFCPTGGKLTDGKCKCYGTLDKVMETFKKSVQKYSRRNL